MNTGLEQMQQVIGQMIDIDQDEVEGFFSGCFVKTFKKKEILSHPHKIPNEIFFINSGILRVITFDSQANEHTIHFALENQFICDYSSFIQKTPSYYSLQALEETEVVVLPRSSIEWGYRNLKQGDRLGRLIAEFYFIYQDDRIKNQFVRSAKERYDSITDVFPDIHQRVPQRMIASYLGITSIHLSRLKKEDRSKT